MKRYIAVLLFASSTVFAEIPVEIKQEINTDKKKSYVAEIVEDIVETTTKVSNGFIDDVEKDGLNFNITTSAQFLEIYPIDNKPAPDGQISSDAQNIILGNLTINLLPNTWKIKISYGVVLQQSDGWTSSQYHVLDEGDDKMELIEIYTRPISLKIGEFGFGYHQYKNSINIHAGGTADAVDIPLQLEDGFTVNGYASARYVGEITREYITYNFPDIEYIPTGLQLEVFREKSNHARNLIDGSFIFHPKTESHGFSFGINKTIEEMDNGFNIKSFLISSFQNTHKYYDYVNSINKEINSTSSEYKISVAYRWKGNSGRQFYVAPTIAERTHSDVDEKYREGSIEIGVTF